NGGLLRCDILLPPWPFAPRESGVPVFFGFPLSSGMHGSMLACPPNLVGQFRNHPQLLPLLFLGEKISLLGGSEAALRRQTQLLQRNILCVCLDTPLESVS